MNNSFHVVFPPKKGNKITPIPAFMILSVLSDSITAGADLFLPVGGWAVTPGLPGVWCGSSAFMVEVRGDEVRREEEPAPCCSCQWITFWQDWSGTHRVPGPSTPAPPSDPRPREREKASQKTPRVWGHRRVLCCLSSALYGASSGCKRRPPWQEALLSVSSAPQAHAHQLAELRGGFMTHGEHWGAQFSSVGSHFLNYLLASFKAKTKVIRTRTYFQFQDWF